MKRSLLVLFGLLLAAWAASGCYIIQGNEQAVIRRLGRVLTTGSGAVALRASGLHYDLPWPLSRVDRVNLNQIRTLTIGSAEVVDVEGAGFLQSAEAAGESQFLTGDKNVLHLQLNVHYRIAAGGVDRFLFGSESVDRRLQLLVESIAADLVSQSGVDYVHPLGLGELREQLTARTREMADALDLGVDVEEVAINSVYPPIQVKAQFLEVSNARADKEKSINQAAAYAEQKLAAARAESQQTLDAAQTFRQESIEAARGMADSFTKLVEQFRREEQQGVQSYAAARQMAARRIYTESIEDVLRVLAGKVFLDSGKPVDLTIFRDPKK
jgi:membrane protease subunit HflK